MSAINNYEIQREIRDLKIFINGLITRVEALEKKNGISSMSYAAAPGGSPVVMSAPTAGQTSVTPTTTVTAKV